MKTTLAPRLSNIVSYFSPQKDAHTQKKTQEISETLQKSTKPEFVDLAKERFRLHCDQKAALRIIKWINPLLAALIEQNGGYIGWKALYGSLQETNDIDIFFTSQNGYEKFVSNLNQIAKGKPLLEPYQYRGKIEGVRYQGNHDSFDGRHPFIAEHEIDVVLVEKIIQPEELLQCEKAKEYVREKLSGRCSDVVARYVASYRKDVQQGEIVNLPVYADIEIAYFEDGVPVPNKYDAKKIESWICPAIESCQLVDRTTRKPI